MEAAMSAALSKEDLLSDTPARLEAAERRIRSMSTSTSGALAISPSTEATRSCGYLWARSGR